MIVDKLEKSLERPGRLWSEARDLLEILKQSRFSLIIVLAAVVSLLGVPAIEDILVGLSHPENWLQKPLFVLAVNWLAFQAWGWARYVFAYRFDADADRRWQKGWRKTLIDWLPRAYAIATFGLAAFAAFRADIAGVGWGIVVIGAAAAWFLFERRNIRSTALRRVAQPRVWQYYVTAAVVLGSAALAIASPVGFGNALGAGAVLFLGLGCIIPVGSILVRMSRKNGFPVVLAALLAAVIFSAWNDNHHVRLLDKKPDSAAPQRALADYFAEWEAQAAPGRPLVLVATAGGGLRATYWTDVVLGRLQDAIPGFHRQVFAISGVSGGSVGAVFYNAALAHEAECVGADGKPCFADKLLAAVGRDYLAPVTASFLFPDLMQRFTPFALFADRAAALEESWEHGFRATYPAADCGLDKAFLDLYSAACGPAGHWAPLLLINGTYEQTGRRILTAPFALEPGVFPDTHDFHRLNRARPIPASTAAHNSARFTYLSPAGTFGDGAGSVIDGGYFENYGAATLADLLRWLRDNHAATLARRGLVVITISNDAAIPLGQYSFDARPDGKPFTSFLNEALAPVRGMLATRNAHGMLAYKRLESVAREAVPGAGLTWAHFYLGVEQEDEKSVPLTWILSQQVQAYMRQQLTEGENCAALTGVGAALAAAVGDC